PMTTRALVKNSPRDHDLARIGLVDYASTAKDVVGGRRVRVVAEPLLRRRSDGTRVQSLRVAVEGLSANLRPGDVIVLTPDGYQVDAEVIDGPSGSVRVLVPEVHEPRQFEIGLPRLDAERRVQVRADPQREWTVHLVHHSHLDIGYTDPQGTVLAQHVAFLDSCLDLTDRKSVV